MLCQQNNSLSIIVPSTHLSTALCKCVTQDWTECSRCTLTFPGQIILIVIKSNISMKPPLTCIQFIMILLHISAKINKKGNCPSDEHMALSKLLGLFTLTLKYLQKDYIGIQLWNKNLLQIRTAQKQSGGGVHLMLVQQIIAIEIVTKTFYFLENTGPRKNGHHRCTKPCDILILK